MFAPGQSARAVGLFLTGQNFRPLAYQITNNIKMPRNTGTSTNSMGNRGDDCMAT